MQINADFLKSALVRRAANRWTPSPSPGVERLMFDRIGGEVARATSLVRYAPGSRFDTHTHNLGEEFLVLEGTFSDSAGDYGPGTYVRNPPGSAHAPWSEDGCTIFVKLRQFDVEDRRRVVIDSSRTAGWTRLEGGAEQLHLHRFGSETVRLYRLGSGRGVELDGAGGLEVFVLEGALEIDGTRLDRHDWLRLPPGLSIKATAAAPGTQIYVKSGHLTAPENHSISGH